MRIRFTPCIDEHKRIDRLLVFDGKVNDGGTAKRAANDNGGSAQLPKVVKLLTNERPGGRFRFRLVKLL